MICYAICLEPRRIHGLMASADDQQEKHWKIIADNLIKAGWSLGCVSAIDCDRRTIWIVDAQRDDATGSGSSAIRAT